MMNRNEEENWVVDGQTDSCAVGLCNEAKHNVDITEGASAQFPK